MDVFDRYAASLEDEKRKEFLKHKTAALEYTKQGFDENMVSELLQLDGCSKETSHVLASASVDDLPDDYTHGDPPKTFEDVSRKVDHTIKSASIEDIQVYFEKYSPQKYRGIAEDVKTARATGLDSHYREVASQIRPLVNSLITNNKVDFNMGKVISAGKKEILEKDLWGIWPTELMKKHAEKEKSKDRVLKKTDRREKKYSPRS